MSDRVVPAAQVLDFVARERAARGDCPITGICDLIGATAGVKGNTVESWLRRAARTGHFTVDTADTIVTALGGSVADVPALALDAEPVAGDGRCPTCRETVSVLADGRCMWCDTQTGAAIPVAAPSGPGGPRPGLRAGEPGYGPTCPECDGTKSPAAHMCAGCRRKRGQRTPDRDLGVTTHRAILIEEDVLEDARRLYATGLGLRRVAREILPRTGYASEHSCAVALHGQFHRRGWPLRPRLAAALDACTTHGQTSRTTGDRNAYKRARRRRQPPCAGTTRDGSPCRLSAARGRTHCRAHDPALVDETRAQIAAVRARIADLDQCAGTVEHGDRTGERCMHRSRAGETHCWRHTHQLQEAA